MSRLKEQYQNEIVDAMIKKFGYKNIMEVPKLDKIVVNMGVGEAKENAKLLEAAIKDMEAITGQKAVATKAKNSIANFKIREGMAIGCKTTLRGEKMYEFMDRLINLALPRVRDFRGVNPNAFDGRGNYALGIKEQLIFPEIDIFASSIGVLVPRSMTCILRSPRSTFSFCAYLMSGITTSSILFVLSYAGASGNVRIRPAESGRKKRAATLSRQPLLHDEE